MSTTSFPTLVRALKDHYLCFYAGDTYVFSEWSKPVDARKCKACVEKLEKDPQAAPAAAAAAAAPPAAKQSAAKEKQEAFDPAKYVCKTMEELLEKREFLLRFSPLIGCVAGSRTIGKGVWPTDLERAANHFAVAELLLDAGARIDAKASVSLH